MKPNEDLDEKIVPIEPSATYILGEWNEDIQQLYDKVFVAQFEEDSNETD